MQLAPLLEATPVIQVHMLSALAAILVGPFALYRRRRDRWHRRLGYGWTGAMLLAATSALFIPSAGLALLGPFGPIHALVLLVYAGLWQAIRAIRAGRVTEHRAAMSSLYWRGIGIAGLFTLMPGRIVNRMVLPEWPEAGWGLIGLGLCALFLVPRLATARQRRAQQALKVKQETGLFRGQEIR
ncbi:putative membrane protein [Candidatus Rhodobacter oscarellae]|uniref:Putative membrane protein n=1 Tax=Candidatus Rhodobacter oscarellae TaxID=1675527 RepID=A0A0J9E334_9RHOB|nr:DUF2306 domain-containing protein [Candidatus Rhodobacter lobularis]KMW57150.1 putative membrane protein [Candidatus Rhodobacter lobularis]